MADENEKKKTSCGCCFLKVLGAFVALALIAGGVVGYFAVQIGTWVENAQEAAPAVYAPLNVSPGEQEDVERILQHINVAKADKSIIDETITPAVFNGIVDKIVRNEKEKGKQPEFDAFRGGIDGEHFTLTATKKVKTKTGDEKYANVQLTFDCEIEDGKFNKLNAVKIVAGGKEAPATVKMFLNFMAGGFVKGVNENTSPEAKKFAGFKLIKREGDRVHIILDPSKFDKTENNAPAPKPETPVDPNPKKDSF